MLMNLIYIFKIKYDYIFLFAVIAVLLSVTIVDVAMDIGAMASTKTIIIEVGLGIVGLLSIGGVAYHFKQKSIQINQLNRELDLAQSLLPQLTDLQLMRRNSLSALIKAQFREWQLSDSECQIAMLLLKGFSSKEIALLRNTSDTTVRQQASAVYKKANVAGRHVFSAWFFEDMM